LTRKESVLSLISIFDTQSACVTGES